MSQSCIGSNNIEYENTGNINNMKQETIDISAEENLANNFVDLTVVKCENDIKAEPFDVNFEFTPNFDQENGHSSSNLKVCW